MCPLLGVSAQGGSTVFMYLGKIEWVKQSRSSCEAKGFVSGWAQSALHCDVILHGLAMYALPLQSTVLKYVHLYSCISNDTSNCSFGGANLE